MKGDLRDELRLRLVSGNESLGKGLMVQHNSFTALSASLMCYIAFCSSAELSPRLCYPPSSLPGLISRPSYIRRLCTFRCSIISSFNPQLPRSAPSVPSPDRFMHLHRRTLPGHQFLVQVDGRSALPSFISHRFHPRTERKRGKRNSHPRRPNPHSPHMRILPIHMIRHNSDLYEVRSYRFSSPPCQLPSSRRSARRTHSPSAPILKCCQPPGRCRSTHLTSCRSPWYVPQRREIF